jgi:hypothetical protein
MLILHKRIFKILHPLSEMYDLHNKKHKKNLQHLNKNKMDNPHPSPNKIKQTNKIIHKKIIIIIIKKLTIQSITLIIVILKNH